MTPVLAKPNILASYCIGHYP